MSATWQTFECNLSELKAALLRDQQRLGLLDRALQQGSVSQDVASSVIDVAKLLSEKQDLCFQVRDMMKVLGNILVFSCVNTTTSPVHLS